MGEKQKSKSLITRVGDVYRSAASSVFPMPLKVMQLATNGINRAAVSSNSEILRNITAGATGIINLPNALSNRVNATITSVLPEWTEEKADNPVNAWTIDKGNHLARYYDSTGKQVIASPVGIGLISGNKSKEGDNKSPDGTYRLSGPENGANKKGGTSSFGKYFYRTNHRNKSGSSSGVGIHGTGNPLFNGMNISHGCFRVDNRAIEKFHDIAPNNGGGSKIIIYEKKGGMIPKFQNPSQPLNYRYYLDDPEFMARMAARYGIAPGMNTNSGEEQNSKQKSQQKKKDKNTVSRGDVVVKARKQGRNLADEREEINRYLSTQPDAVGRALDKTADILGGIGTVSGLAGLGMGLLAAPGATAGGLAGSILGEKPIDALTNYVANYNNRGYNPYLSEEDNKPKYTTFTNLISEKTGLSPNLASFLHPGMWIGGALGARGGQAIENVVPQVNRFLASPYTGRWTQFGNREYRLSPGYLYTNGAHYESRPVTTQAAQATQASESPLFNQEGAISISRIRRALNERGAGDLYTAENIAETLPQYGVNITEMNIPNYPRYTAFSGPRSRLYALQHDVNAKLADRGAAPIEIIGLDGRINWGNRPNTNPFGYNTTTARQPLPEPPREITVNVEPSREANNRVQTDLRTRELADIEQLGRYTYDDIFYPNGMPKVDLSHFRRVHTGAHGSFINTFGMRSRPEEVFEKLVTLRENPQIGRNEVSSIRREAANKPGSGIIIHTHDGDLSVDSHPLANIMQSSLGKEAYRLPLESHEEVMVPLNNLGYKGLFMEPNQWEISPELMDRLRANYAQTGKYLGPDMHIVRDRDGSLIIRENDSAIGRIQARPQEQVKHNIDKRIQLVNDKYNLNYPFSELRGSGPDEQWTFDREIYVPNQKHIILKNGGYIVRKFKNDRRKRIL